MDYRFGLDVNSEPADEARAERAAFARRDRAATRAPNYRARRLTPDRTFLFEPRVPGGAHAGELRHFLAAQAGSSPANGRGQADVGGSDATAPVAEKIAQFLAPDFVASDFVASDLVPGHIRDLQIGSLCFLSGIGWQFLYQYKSYT